MNNIRVLIVDDSAQARRLLTRILEQDPGIEVCGTACDPYDARGKIKQLNPDVLTLDIEMPKMDGITFLRNLMRLHPMPVIMISGFTENDDATCKQALQLGALSCIHKPGVNTEANLEIYSQEIIYKVKQAAATQAESSRAVTTPDNQTNNCLSADAVISKINKADFPDGADSLIAIGASTGGTEAIKQILQDLPADAPAVVITQHISIPFSTNFARRMNSISALTVCEAQDGQKILPGHAYIAPGNRHLMIAQDGPGYVCKLSDGPPVNHHKPSVDVLFRSASQSAGPKAICVLLTGMGKDGAHGMKEMHETGARTIAQDEKSSVVWGMPGTAVRLGVVDSVLPIEKIASKIKSLLYNEKASENRIYRGAKQI